jgi:YVTN family beta-propeller protein
VRTAITLVVTCCLSVLSAQSLEKTLLLPDSLGGFPRSYECGPAIWDSAVNRVFVPMDSGVMVIDCSTRQRIAIIRTGFLTRSLCISPRRNKIYCAMDKVEDAIAVIDDRNCEITGTVDADWPRGLCYDSSGDKVYFSNATDSSLTVIDCALDIVCATIPVGMTGSDLLCNVSQEHKLYYASRRKVVVIDTRADTVLARMDVDADCAALCYNATSNKVCFAGAHSTGGSVCMVDAAADSIVARVEFSYPPVEVCWDSRDNRVYCSSEQGVVRAIDGEGDSLLSSVWAGGSGRHGLCYNPRQNKVYCAGYGNDGYKVYVIDCLTNDVRAVSAMQPVSFCYDALNDRVYAESYGGDVAIIDGPTEEVIGLVMTWDDIWALCYNAQDSKLYFASRKSNSVGVIDCDEHSVVARVPVGTEPVNVCYNSRENKVYSANVWSRTVSVIDAGSDTVVATIMDAGWTGAMCYNSQDNKLYCTGRYKDLLVIDGASDRVVARIPDRESIRALFYNPVVNKVYRQNSADGSIDIISGSADTVIATLELECYYGDMCYSSRSGNTYFGDCFRFSVAGIDGAGDSLIDTLHLGDYTRRLCYDSLDDLLYCPYKERPGPYMLAVIDCANFEVLDKVLPTFSPYGQICYSPRNNWVYCVMDTAVMSVVVIKASTSVVRDTIEIGRGLTFMLPASASGRVYLASAYSRISVLRDSALGMEEAMSERGVMSAGPSIVRGVLALPVSPRPRVSESPCLLDACGRKVMELAPGANDVRELAPGVYFVHSTFDNRQSKMTKVVVTR